MKKIASSLYVLFILLFLVVVPSSSNASTGFILGLLVGDAISSNSQSSSSISNNIIYIMPGLKEKLPEAEYLNIRIISVIGNTNSNSTRLNRNLGSRTILDIFYLAFSQDKNPSQYAILQVSQRYSPSLSGDVLFNFMYIEKNKLKNTR